MRSNSTSIASRVRGRTARAARPAMLLILTMLVALVPFGAGALAAGGDFRTVDFQAAEAISYTHETGGGAWNDGDQNFDIKGELQGGDFTCSDTVTYLVKIVNDGSGTDDPQTLRVTNIFNADATGQTGAGHIDVSLVTVNYGQVENGDDGSGPGGGPGTFGLDSAINDDRQTVAGGDTETGGSTVTVIDEGFDENGAAPFINDPAFGPYTNGWLYVTYEVDGLSTGETVVIRIDTKLGCKPGTSPTGNLQAKLIEADVVAINDGVAIEPDAAGSGAQTINFKNIGEITGAGEPLLEIEKTVMAAGGTCGVDDVEQLAVTAGDTVTYCYAISNPGTADLFDVEVVDDNGTPANTSDDFTLIVGTLGGVSSVTLQQNATLNIGGTVVNTAEASGNNGKSGGNYQELTDADTATVIVEGPPNQPPVAVDDNATTPEDTPITINVAANDNDPDDNLDPTTTTLISGPSNGTLVNNGDGTFTYTPNANFNGTDSFVYEICDLEGLCDQATVTITVTPVNDAPDAVDDSYSTAEDTPLTVPAPGVLDNDKDVDGDTLTVTSYTQPANGTVTQNADGSLTYTPNANFNGTDSYTYTISDGNGGTDTATVTITVSPVNDAPDAVDDNATVNEDGSVDIPVLNNDVDPDGDPLTVTEVSDPPNGTATINPDGTVNYTPDPDFCGQDSFTYTISDGNGGTDTATVTVDVTCVNDPPVANDDTAATDEDIPVTIPVLDNDNDPDDDPLTVTAVSDPPNGSVVINPDGTVTYTPDPNFNGEDTFTYTISDGNGGTDTATVTVTVGALNDPPVAEDDSATTPEDTPVLINVADNDYDVDGNLDPSTTTVLTPPAHGTLVNNGDGTFSYTPDPNYNGPDSFTYQICDTDGLCDMATVNITVTPVNDAPDAKDDSYNATEDTPLNIPAPGVLDNDVDVDGDTLTVVSYTQPSNGTLTQNPDGSFIYTPDENFCGQDSYTYTISDGNGGSDTATVTIDVACVNDAPVAVDDTGSTDEDTVLNVPAPGILFNDYDVDGDSLTVSAVNGDAASVGQQITLASGALLTANADGSYSYDPNGQYDYLAVGETAQESFTYTISDGNGGSDTATVTITITGVNDAPVAVDDAYTGQQDETLTIAAPGVLVNDYDVDGDAILVDSYDATSQFGGSISLNPDGSFSYTPAPGFAGVDTFTYTISDGNGGYDTATVTITVEAKNNRSIAVQFQDWTYSGGTLSGSVSIQNQSGPYPVQIDDLAIEVQYKVPGGGGWTYVAVADGSCSFDPATPFVIGPDGTQTYTFSGCQLEEMISGDATVRVTAKVHVFGRFMGKGKADGWFLDRLSKAL